jgi:D(-)-tartrate dehydratase
MRVVDLRAATIPISRYEDPALPSGGLDTGVVAIVSDVIRNGKPLVGYGFASVGRFGQSGLINERFAPRLLACNDLADPTGNNINVFRAWQTMMAGEKPGGHGERCVAIGTIDMALWDLAAKIAGLPLHQYLRIVLGREGEVGGAVPAYSAGGYPYPANDSLKLREEILRMRDLGFTRAKIKIGTASLADDLRRIEVASRALGTPEFLAVDAMNLFSSADAIAAAPFLALHGLWWWEDICDPLDFETQSRVATLYPGPIAAGEAMFSSSEANLLDLHAGLRRERDVLVFDPVHCYGIPGYLSIIDLLEARGWSRKAFWPHGGHLFCLHLVAALGLGGVEVNPFCFQPFCGYGDSIQVVDGQAKLPDFPGIGFEHKPELRTLFERLV